LGCARRNAVYKSGASTPVSNLVSGIDMVWIGSNIVSQMFDRSAIWFDRTRCINVGPHTDCMRCKEACARELPDPEGDLAIAGRFQDQCDRCGACASECPTGAIELPDDIYGRRLSRLSLQLKQYASAEEPGSYDSLILSCGEPTNDEVPGSYGGCISWLDQAAMLHLLAADNTNLQIALGACAEVGHQKASLCISRLTRHAEASNSLLKLIGAEVRITVLSNADSKTSHTSRHADLMDRGTAIHETLQRGLTMLSPKRDLRTSSQENGLGESSKADRRFVAVLATKTLIDRAKPEERLLPIDEVESPVGPLSRKGPRINKELCVACGACSLFCPTGALRKRQVERGGAREWRLSLDLRQCVGCAVCVRGCETPGAIKLVDRGLSGIWRDKSIILIRRDSSFCEICGTDFAINNGSDGGQGSARQCPACNLKKLRFAGFY